jgi:hypothetical protein
MSIAEIEARRAARKAALAKQREEQYAKDLEKLDELEIKHGDGAVAPVEVPAFCAGLPTMAIVRAPSSDEYKRFRDRIARAQAKGPAVVAAQDELASSCRVYPDVETYKAMCERYAGLHSSAVIAVVRLADARAADEGKD